MDFLGSKSLIFIFCRAFDQYVAFLQPAYPRIMAPQNLVDIDNLLDSIPCSAHIPVFQWPFPCSIVALWSFGV
jgi:hypothetical protein